MHIANTFIMRSEAADRQSEDVPSVTLTLADRRRSRQRLTLDDGVGHVGMAIDRGKVLRDGDMLVTQKGLYIRVIAAAEDVIRVTASSPWQLARAAYHLGNRHILLEIAEGYLQFEYDAVLVDMLDQIGGLTAQRLQAVFEPDVGAYGGGHRHGHDESFDEDQALAQKAYHTHESVPGKPSIHDHDHGKAHASTPAFRPDGKSGHT